MKTRADFMEDAKNVLEIITTYKVLKQEQLLRAIFNKNQQKRQAVIRLLEREKRIYLCDDLVSSEEKWSKHYDKGLITAFWILLDFEDEVLFHTLSAFPAKIDFVTYEDAFDIIAVEKGQETFLNAFYKRHVDKTVKHLVAIEDKEQMHKLSFPGIAGFCLVDDNGNISYYKEK